MRRLTFFFLPLAATVSGAAAATTPVVNVSMQNWTGKPAQVAMDVDGLERPFAVQINAQGKATFSLPTPKKGEGGAYLTMGYPDDTSTLGSLTQECKVAGGTYQISTPKLLIFKGSLEGWAKIGKGYEYLSSTVASNPLPSGERAFNTGFFLIYTEKAASVKGKATCKADFDSVALNVSLKPGWNLVRRDVFNAPKFGMRVEYATAPFTTSIQLPYAAMPQSLADAQDHYKPLLKTFK
ncbi:MULTISPECIES: hypothetical protein [unclassified Deinococcus]|uniref:hypothetical protein n=1 Tax=unclassified Deinococcus TaxID=2623546 RepID=UPI00099468AA|nr:MULTISPECIES: hypothetical protein [unclassified Deinococcus]MCD0175598.1 hypothetical protein [Deinococcus sp. 14RED07]OOV13994.1 hypothetical protein BXU09_04165 [Deinococcus sp. LM3]